MQVRNQRLAVVSLSSTLVAGRRGLARSFDTGVFMGARTWLSLLFISLAASAFAEGQPTPEPSSSPIPSSTPAPSPNPAPGPALEARYLDELQRDISGTPPGGSYTIPPGIYTWRRKSEKNMLVIAGRHVDGGGRVVLDCGAQYSQSESGSKYGVLMRGGSLRGITLRNCYRAGIRVEYAGGPTVIEDCYIYDCGVNNSNAEGGGIYFAVNKGGYAKDVTIRRCRIDYCYSGVSGRHAANITIDTCWIYGAGWTTRGEWTGNDQENATGISTSAGNAGGADWTVTNSVIAYAGDDCFEISKTAGVTLDGNVSLYCGYDPTTGKPGTGDGDGTGVKMRWNKNASDVLITNCVFAFCTYRGIDLNVGEFTRTIINCVAFGGLRGDISGGRDGTRIIKNTRAAKWVSMDGVRESNNDHDPKFADTGPIEVTWDDTKDIAENIAAIKAKAERNFATD